MLIMCVGAAMQGISIRLRPINLKLQASVQKRKPSNSAWGRGRLLDGEPRSRKALGSVRTQVEEAQSCSLEQRRGEQCGSRGQIHSTRDQLGTTRSNRLQAPG